MTTRHCIKKQEYKESKNLIYINQIENNIHQRQELSATICTRSTYIKGKEPARLTIKGLTCNGLATKSEFGLKTNETLSPQGVFVT